ncbi:unnamed protein product [Blepharisma stoltei]|uniref:Uncharacterized protein n=1 Tax=Blepharisma stoltei TaxID=1481888 RepID=A0AAU9KK40_9CILI|nr:unnamed protein product [Blepharisma stoltei]
MGCGISKKPKDFSEDSSDDLMSYEISTAELIVNDLEMRLKRNNGIVTYSFKSWQGESYHINVVQIKTPESSVAFA